MIIGDQICSVITEDGKCVDRFRWGKFLVNDALHDCSFWILGRT